MGRDVLADRPTRPGACDCPRASTSPILPVSRSSKTGNQWCSSQASIPDSQLTPNQDNRGAALTSGIGQEPYNLEDMHYALR